MKRQDDGGRGDLTDEQWQRFQPLLPPQKAHTGQPACASTAAFSMVFSGYIELVRRF